MRVPISHLLLAFTAGAGIGIFFFGGLWWTARRLAAVENPAGLMFSSFLVRTGVTLAALYFVMGGHWERLLSALLGVMVIRIWMVRHLKPGMSVNGDQ